jgi:RHS repeat-associated protein
MKFLYDGDNILYEYDGSDTITTRYVHNLGIDNPLAMERGGKLYEYHKDTLGSITTITDNGGKVIQTYDYDSFGNIVSTKDPAFVQPYTYTGREWDRETGLYYYRARYYDPMEGRFISKDPIGFRGGDVNLYAMVLNNPINAVDPLGLFCITLPSFATWETFGVSEPRYHYSFLFGDPTGPLGICIWNKIRTEFQRRRYVIKQFCCDNKDCNRKTFCYIKEGNEVTEFRDKERSESDTTRAWGWFSGDNPKKVGSACCKNPWTGEIVCQ